jgi:2-polyprenyl-3-methyl-5-hydroxy-6-metoxy-1,4-benzoquinol methylase
MLGRGAHGPILDYGGGIGQQSIFLARQGWHVGYADLGETAAFARWRFEQEGVEILSLAPEVALDLALQPWGAISALDVVEHVPEPVDLLQRLTRVLAPEGLLFLTRHSFKEYPAHLPETAVLQATLDFVLGEMGYRQVIVPDGHFGIGAWQKMDAGSS